MKKFKRGDDVSLVEDFEGYEAGTKGVVYPWGPSRVRVDCDGDDVYVPEEKLELSKVVNSPLYKALK